MVYSEHDFAYNVTNALAVNDTQAVHDIFMSEISGLLQNNKPALVKALQDAGAKIESDATDEKVADAVAEAMVKGRKDVLQQIGAAIVREKQKYSNASDIVTGAMELVTGLAQSSAQITSAVLANKTAKQQGKDAISQARLGITNQLLMGKNATDQARALADIEKQKGKASMGSVGAIVGGVIAVTVIGVIGFILYKKTSSDGAVAVAAPVAK
jgi:hypothetical protein